MENMRFKVGDRVRIKSFDWYNENKDADGFVNCGDKIFDDYMSAFCGSVVNIGGVCPYGYDIREDMQCRTWTDEMIEGLVEEETYDFLKTDIFEADKPYPPKPRVEDFLDMFNDTITLSEGFVFRDQDGNIINATKIILEKKKKEYPKTYGECCGVLGTTFDYPDIRMVSIEECNLYSNFIILKRCRDAYWKIAGEQMELDKPWEPDWKNGTEIKYTIVYSCSMILNGTINLENKILAFPTKEMRDAFYENFKDLIESCKTLL